MDTFADLMANELQRISQERATLHAQLKDIEVALQTLDRELVAIEAYARAKTGKTPKGTNGAGNHRIRASSKREQILAIITANPQGVRRGDLLKVMRLKGDKSGEMSVSNALTSMIKNNTLARNDEKKYVLA